MGAGGNPPVLEFPELLCPGATLLVCEARNGAVLVLMFKLEEAKKALPDLDLRGIPPVGAELRACEE